jgi:hypothetical protein
MKLYTCLFFQIHHLRLSYIYIYTCSMFLKGSILFILAEISSWPSSKTLFLLRLWSLIFPCSDFRHVVMTPAILLMCEYLMRCPIVSGWDIAIGSFLCSMLLSVCIFYNYFPFPLSTVSALSLWYV